MIYLSGDTHGTLDIQKVQDFFETEVLLRNLTKEDFLIILGDVGICWDEGKNDRLVRKILRELPVTTLWIDGNHENFPLIAEYPIQNMYGGKVHVMEKDIIHLMRGNCYNIDGKTFWVFGGGNSVDKMFRTEGISWWKEEMPTDEEYALGIESMEKQSWNVDYILTHTAPRKAVEYFCKDLIQGEEKLQDYLQTIADKAAFKGWYFGHWHEDINVDDKYYGLMEEIVTIR